MHEIARRMGERTSSPRISRNFPSERDPAAMINPTAHEYDGRGKWESGAKRPSGMTLKLLHIAKKRGLAACRDAAQCVLRVGSACRLLDESRNSLPGSAMVRLAVPISDSM
jgi:hypothetical protein